jgi:hypothetical protein
MLVLKKYSSSTKCIHIHVCILVGRTDRVARSLGGGLLRPSVRPAPPAASTRDQWPRELFHRALLHNLTHSQNDKHAASPQQAPEGYSSAGLPGSPSSIPRTASWWLRVPAAGQTRGIDVDTQGVRCTH